MRKIKLTKGEYASVDDNNFEMLSKFNWFCGTNPEGRKQAATIEKGKGKKKRKYILMHRLIMGVVNSPREVYVDHANRNTLDNCRKNLRICNNSLNNANSKRRKDNNSGYKGVYWSKTSKKWVTQIRVNRRAIYLGLFKNKKNAAMAYNNAALEHFGEFARINLIEE